VRCDRHGAARSPLGAAALRLESSKLEPDEIARQVAAFVARDGIAIVPTDTVYGIGCAPASAAAVERIFAAKRRSLAKPLSLHFGSAAELLSYAPGNELAAHAAAHFLPGPLTLIVARPPSVAAFVTRGLATVGLRAPAHALLQAILSRSGPLAATSANRSGEAAFTGSGPVTELPEADVFVDDGPTPLGAESTIVDVSGRRPRIVREGAIGRAMLEAVLGPMGGAG
jgi:L-threonylcarbamoyladenylate synthase